MTAKLHPRDQARLGKEAPQIGQRIDRRPRRLDDLLAIAQPQDPERRDQRQREPPRHQERQRLPLIMQPHPQHRPHGPRRCRIKHLQALAAAQMGALDIIHHIGVEADEIRHRRHRVAHQRQRRCRRRADQRQRHSDKVKRAAPGVHPAPWHQPVRPRHHQPPEQRHDPGQKIDLGRRLGRTHGLAHHQWHDRDQRAAHRSLQPGQQGEMLHFRRSRQGQIIYRHDTRCRGFHAGR